ncbi:MAG: glycosyltransferase family 4 protein [Clostridiales bacterium]|nr:glycosyltransferase family 4 protein [Clostridiales bacterium]
MLRQHVNFDLYVYHPKEFLLANGFSASSIPIKRLNSISIGKLMLFGITPLFKKEYSVYVLCAERKLACNWIYLLMAKLLNKKTILWGHGLNANFYDTYMHKMPIIYKVMYRLADAAWFYTENERRLWSTLLPSLKSVALGNTVSIPTTNKIYTDEEKASLRTRYGIKTAVNFIFCARFSNANRRVDLLVEIINRLNPDIFGFIIIGGGPLKPDFSHYSNVYDHGPVYDDEMKSDLFAIADAYLQPGWTGLSIVEAMAYGKSILTFERSADISQCVEYGYIEHTRNGMVFQNINQLISFITEATRQDYRQMGENARLYYQANLSMSNMVGNALKSLVMLHDEIKIRV